MAGDDDQNRDNKGKRKMYKEDELTDSSNNKDSSTILTDHQQQRQRRRSSRSSSLSVVQENASAPPPPHHTTTTTTTTVAGSSSSSIPSFFLPHDCIPTIPLSPNQNLYFCHFCPDFKSTDYSTGYQHQHDHIKGVLPLTPRRNPPQTPTQTQTRPYNNPSATYNYNTRMTSPQAGLGGLLGLHNMQGCYSNYRSVYGGEGCSRTQGFQPLNGDVFNLSSVQDYGNNAPADNDVTNNSKVRILEDGSIDFLSTSSIAKLDDGSIDLLWRLGIDNNNNLENEGGDHDRDHNNEGEDDGAEADTDVSLKIGGRKTSK